MIKRLFYIAPVRMPTEKAHGYQIVKMCEAWSSLGIEVHLIVPVRNNSIQSDAFDYYGVPRTFTVHYLPVTDVLENAFILRFSLSLLAYALLMFNFLLAVRTFIAARAHNDDVLYTRSWEVIWLFRFRPNLIWEVHEITRLHRFMPWLYARAAGIVVLTSCLKRMISALSPSANIVIAPDAVDLRVFSDILPLPEARQRLDISPHRIAIGYVGRLTLHGKREKGVSDLLRAFAILKSRRSDLLLIIVGGPSSAVRRYEADAHALGIAGDVIFAGQVSRADVPLWLAACDILTIPWPQTEFSSCFTSPLKLFEYMASGKPIIASDLPSLRDILDEHSAVFTPAGDPLGLARACEGLISDSPLRERLGKAARKAVLRYTWDARAASISAFIETALPNHPPL